MVSFFVGVNVEYGGSNNGSSWLKCFFRAASLQTKAEPATKALIPLSSDAIHFGECAGLGLVGWDYPEQNSLKSKIDLSRLYPITALPSLSKAEKQKILNKGIVLCREICDSPTLLNNLGINETKIKRILNEANELCTH